MPRIGFSVWKEDYKRASELIASLFDAGFDHVEVSIDSPLDLGDPELSGIVEAVRGAGLSLGFHAPWKEVFIASPVEEIRSSSTSVVAKILGWAQRYDPEYVVVHGSSDQAVCSKKEDLCIDSLARSLEALGSSGLDIYLEAIQGACCGRVSQLVKLLDRGLDIVFCLDLAHIAVENMIRGRGRWPSRISEAISEVPEALGRRARAIHVHGLRDGGKRPKAHYDFSYTQLGAEDVARAAALWGSGYIVFEVFYRSSGGPASPSDLAGEVRRIRSWASLLG